MVHLPFFAWLLVEETDPRVPLCGFFIRLTDGLFVSLLAIKSGFPTASLAASSKTTFTPIRRKKKKKRKEKRKQINK
jgi:hypothetical protein